MKTISIYDSRIDPKKGQCMGTLRELAKALIKENAGRFEESDNQYSGGSMSWHEYKLTLYSKSILGKDPFGFDIITGKQPQIDITIHYETQHATITIHE